MSTSADSVGHQIARVVEALRDTLGADDVGVMLVDGEGRLRTLGSAGEAGQLLEQAQEEQRDGPGFEVLRTGRTLVVDDVARSPWAKWIDLPAGVRAVLAVPIVVDDIATGNVNVISATARSWSDDDRERAEAAAGAVASLLQVAAAAGAPNAARNAIEVLGGVSGDGDGSDR